MHYENETLAERAAHARQEYARLTVGENWDLLERVIALHIMYAMKDERESIARDLETQYGSDENRTLAIKACAQRIRERTDNG